MKIPILVPSDAELLLSRDQKVDFGTPFLRRSATRDVRIPLAASLGFPPDRIFVHLHKFVGDVVQKNEVLAERKTMMSTKQYLSEHNGVIKEINHYDGSVTITVRTGECVEETCYFRGTVEEIEGGFLFVRVSRGKAYQLAVPCQYFGGKILYFEGTPVHKITEETVNETVICAPKFQSYDHTKLEALGARGFIVVEAPDEQSQTPVAVLRSKHDCEEIRKHSFSSCNIGPDHTTIYLYD
ncbi:MAG: hypothetical protein N2691_01820 [Patescibacteria group bacterium]|nr:hypothetical protein [Patescibacteria group bacterium]